MARKQESKVVHSFENAMGELEALVEAMENDRLPLEDLVDHYEKGAKLLQHCEQVLATARKRIELIEVGRPSEKELAPHPNPDEAQDSADSPPSGPAEDNDIRLF